MVQKTRLFVYGTLRRDLGHPLHSFLKEHGRFIGLGTVQGKLVDLGSYPGLVRSDNPADRVLGEVFVLSLEPERVLRRLDEYEGCGDEEPLYRREKMTVSLDHGGQEQAWVYVFNGAATGRPEIASGDYVAYVASRSAV
ncbi:MAG: gamma-glutamylcyclotransferase [Calditrichaeota bacterium]|nr:MAG: gamma-glutamylcyclotransferase [Calditrichota bacterium]